MASSYSPRIAVIIPAYNATSYIAEALESVFIQGYDNLEVIVVNDGSPDSRELEQVIAPYRDRILYIRQENGGTAAARNAGIRATDADLIALLDADDVWESDFLTKHLAYLQEHPDVDLVYGDAVFMGGDLSGRRYMDLCPTSGEVTLEGLLSRRCHVMIGVLAKRSALLETGLFCEAQRCEDFDMWCRFAHAGFRIGYHRDVVLRYRRAGQGKSADAYRNLIAVIQVYHSFLRELELSGPERDALTAKLAEYCGELLVLDAKRDFEHKRYREAAQKLGAASAGKSQRLTLIAALLRTCPSVLHMLWTGRMRLQALRAA